MLNSIRLVLFCFAILTSFSLEAQSSASAKRIAVTGTDVSEFKLRDRSGLSKVLSVGDDSAGRLKGLSATVVRSLSADPQFSVIDRSNTALLDSERERQKSIDYIDGYTVEQGRLEGVDLMIKPAYRAVDHSMTLQVIDVASARVDCEVSSPIEESGGITNEKLQQLFSELVTELNADCFSRTFPVVRATDSKKGKAREVLVALGKQANLREDTEIGFYRSEEIEVDGRKLKRDLKVGQGKVEEVQDDNFSIVKVSDGQADLHSLLTSGIRVFCKIERI